MKRNNKKGFTIVELVIVIAVIAILSAVLIPTFSGIVDKANESAAQQAARNKYTELYANDLADDGVLDDAIYTTDYAYVVSGTVATVTIKSNGKIVTYNGTTYGTADSIPTAPATGD